jgi:FkbM family methyltransferase
MRQLVYKFIYNTEINFILRNINKKLSPVLPKHLRIPPSGLIKIKNSQGKTLKIKTNQTSYLTQLIFWNGYNQFEYTDIFIRLINKVNVFYDIGANIGFYSLIAAMENREIKVVGFEPASGPLYYFKENIRINNFENITVEPLALSHKEEGEIEFYEIKNKKYKYLEYNLSGEGNAGIIPGKNYVINKVRTTTLDNYVKINRVKNIDLIKIDTEGTENLILQKSSSVLKNIKPIIICETLFNTIEPELERIMRSFGYQFFNHTKAGLEEVETIMRKEDDGIRNCFFVHRDKYSLVEEFVVL